ncbi:hypothetical protein HHK36_014960 [Tetracentron sinense]|uniref:Uncharacterized protein n=1 Tax=Tetracentron sinense TaxID=13715 RepID=A0A835DGA1_TETSI|nr:hypothetical protein HHK36_014960 [Tetracentron sinense]
MAIYCEANAMVEEYVSVENLGGIRDLQVLQVREEMSRERSRYLEAMVYESLEHRLVVAEASKTHKLCRFKYAQVVCRNHIKCPCLIVMVDSGGLRVPQFSSRLKLCYLYGTIGMFSNSYINEDFMSGKTALRNIMSILLPGVNAIISDRTNQVYSQLLEKAVHLSLDIIILVLEKDLFLADYWRPLYQIGIPRFWFGENFDPGSYVVGVLESLSNKEKRTDKIITQNVEVHDLSAICAAPLAVLECYFLQAQGSLGLSVMGGPNSNLEELLEFEEENKLLFKEIEEKGRL